MVFWSGSAAWLSSHAVHGMTAYISLINMVDFIKAPLRLQLSPGPAHDSSEQACTHVSADEAHSEASLQFRLVICLVVLVGMLMTFIVSSWHIQVSPAERRPRHAGMSLACPHIPLLHHSSTGQRKCTGSALLLLVHRLKPHTVAVACTW